jgi:hypothetical protein
LKNKKNKYKKSRRPVIGRRATMHHVSGPALTNRPRFRSASISYPAQTQRGTCPTVQPAGPLSEFATSRRRRCGLPRSDDPAALFLTPTPPLLPSVAEWRSSRTWAGLSCVLVSNNPCPRLVDCYRFRGAATMSNQIQIFHSVDLLDAWRHTITIYSMNP